MDQEANTERLVRCNGQRKKNTEEELFENENWVNVIGEVTE